MARPNHARRLLAAIPAALAVLTSVPPGAGLSAQSLSDGEVRGRVVEAQTGSAARGALVTLRDADGRALEERRTTRDGLFRFSYLEPGAYQLRVEQVGFRPVRVAEVELERGSALSLQVALEPASPAADGVVTLEAPGAGLPGDGRVGRIDGQTLRLLPFPARSAGDLHLESTRATAASFEGLPATALQLRLGATAAPVGLAGSGDGPALDLPADVLADAAWRSLPDVEFDAPAGTALDLHLPRGRGAGGHALGMAGSTGLLDADYDAGAADAYAQGSYDARWANGAGVSGGVAWRRRSLPAAPEPALEAAAAAVVESASQRYGRALEPFGAPEERVLSAFGRLDLPVGGGALVRGLAVVTDRSAPGAGAGEAVFAGGVPAATGRVDGLPAEPGLAGLVELDVSAPVSRTLGSETRLGAGLSDADGDEAIVPSGIGPIRVGSRDAGESRTTLSGSQVFHALWRSHHLKAGASVDHLTIERDVLPTAAPDFRFADGAAFGAARGFYGGAPAGAVRTSAALPRFAVFAQDVWHVTPRFRLLAGARLVVDAFPADEIDFEERWYFSTGAANNAVDNPLAAIEPRVGLVWEAGPPSRATRAYASVGLHHDRLDPRAIVELIGNDGSLAVRRVEGDLGVWPSPPSAGGVARDGLTVPGPTFRPPRTLRAQGGLVRRVANGRFGVELVARHTDRLLARRDANRKPTAWGSDQHGRALWAPPVVVDGMMGASTGWQLVPDFDHVWELDADAYSSYYGATVFATLAPAGPVVLAGSYTFSRTRDDWPGAPGRAGSAPPPGLATDDHDWLDGTSDYDVPHSALVEARLALPLPATPVAALRYRFRSGLPFTPGYQAGLDYNGDGLDNDPAFIDGAVGGMDPLLADWDCLRENDGSVSPRNACRSEPVHALDASLHVDLVPDRASLVLEATGLLASRSGPVDNALYRLDPGTPPVQSGAIVAIPLVVNPDFGSVLVDTSSVATLRVGLRVAF